MKKIMLFSFLICFLTGCAVLSYQYAKTDSIRLGMTKEEVLPYLKSSFGIAKSASARRLDNGQLEESIELTENYDKYTFIFVDGRLTEWYTVTIPPAPTIIQSPPPASNQAK